MNPLILSCSLSPTSHSAILARHLESALVARGHSVTFIDLRDLDLPFCDATTCYGHPKVIELQQTISTADAVTLATPIYNYDVGGATRNLIALTGQSWNGKLVGFLCAAGGQNSYMSVMGLANSLMLDFRCLIVPRFVYAAKSAFTDGQLTDPQITARLDDLAVELQRLAGV
ncbi:MAG: NADPH-dependent FMN reductase [Phycisphaerae bacterium]